ncbi:stress response protein Rds1 [Viridothelium virens]|uniref:Stress response protein Rds1 n=1 Tax=Viridothelium virens TaxID=1048519 RepID=A0A6A6HF88_VIRVR|nr:stress response protein Rds1 [Viridothelium virens]
MVKIYNGITVIVRCALAAGLVAAAPAPQQYGSSSDSGSGTAESTGFSTAYLPGYNDADASFVNPNPTAGPLASTFGPGSQISAVATAPPTGTIPNIDLSAPPRRSSDVTGATSHGPFSGSATTTGAANGPATLAASVGTLPPNPTATYYNTDGIPQNPLPAPYTPDGGLGTNGSQPRYMVNSDFDFESITLGLYQEWIELDLFNNGLAIFSDDDFAEAGLTAEHRSLIQFMANQESGHATLLTNMLGETAPPQCTYNYPYTTVREWLDFNQVLTRWGESGVWGFINHLDSREVGQLLAQSIATEARQQMSFRQMSGLFPMPVWFETGIPQSWAWTYLAPYISTCPENTTRLAWQNFPALHVVNNPNINRLSANDTTNYEVTGYRTSDPGISTIPSDESCQNLNVTGYGCEPGVTRNKTEPLSFPGREVVFEWETPGLKVGPNNSYVTSTTAGDPKYVAWVAQLNLTYTPLTITGPNRGSTFQPASEVYEGDPTVNGTMFVALTDEYLDLSPFNLSMINPHVRALGIYQAG